MTEPYSGDPDVLNAEIVRLRGKITKLRLALEEIVATERDDDSICAADRCADIARTALNEETK